MMRKENEMATSAMHDELIEKRIYMIRGKKVMLDSDLAKLYGVTTKALNQAVKRNVARFPYDFMYLLTNEEVASLRSQFVTVRMDDVENTTVTESSASSNTRRDRKRRLHAFTEQGVAMLSTVLNSERAIQVNIQIMRAFTRLRELLVSNEMLRQKIEEMEKKYDQQFQVVFEAIKKLIEPIQDQPKRQIGFHTKRHEEVRSAAPTVQERGAAPVNPAGGTNYIGAVRPSIR